MLLILCEHLLTLWFHEMLIDIWSVPAVTMTLNAKDTQWEEAARALTAEDSAFVVMLTTIQVEGYGLSLHY